jgi:putative ABC transport system permease protein
MTISCSFLLESVLLALAAAGSAVLFTFPLNWLEASLGSFVTMSKIQFHLHVGPGVIAKASVFALALGILGGFVPALFASRRNIVAGLRR